MEEEVGFEPTDEDINPTYCFQGSRNKPDSAIPPNFQYTQIKSNYGY